MNHALLKIVASAALGNTPTGPDATFPQWGGPNPSIVHIQVILYSSLWASLLAAFIAMLGKQWLNRYASVERGSIIDRGHSRKRKMDGMVTWRFNLVMECLPLMLQAALFLLGYALSEYLYFINKTIASIAIGFTTFGLLFYLLIVSAATLSYNCPFQTPLSLILRYLIRFDNKHKKYLERSGKWLRCIFSQKKNRPRQGSRPGSPVRFSTFDQSNFDDHVELPLISLPHQPPPLFKFNKETNWDVYLSDSECIALTFKMSMDEDEDIAMATAKFIPEIVWHAGIRAAPLSKLYDMFYECFDRSSGCPIVKPAFRDMTYLSAKALLHMTIQRKCIGGEPKNDMFESVSSRHQLVGSNHYEGDSDLESTLGIIDRVFGNFEPMDWQNFSFTIPHHAWMGHILLYRAWDVLRKGEPLPDEIREFILHSLRLVPPPPASIVADCLFIIGLVLEIRPHAKDILVLDKRWVDPVCVLCVMRLNRPATVRNVTRKSPGSTTSSLRCSGASPPPPMRSITLWRPWS